MIRRAALSLAALFLAVTLASCFTMIKQPRQWRSATGVDVQDRSVGDEVTGQACNHMILGLAAIGDAGYDAALKDALRDKHLATMTDVRADTSIFSVLFFYVRVCTIVTGRVVE